MKNMVEKWLPESKNAKIFNILHNGCYMGVLLPFFTK